jgi:undecaprenyl-diphosphatase
MFTTLKNWDLELFVWLNNLGVEKYDSFWLFATQIESWIPLFIFFLILIIYFYGTRKGLFVAFFTILMLTATLLFTNLVKVQVCRLRPNNVEAMTDLIRILQKPHSYSFFSGHASSSFAVTTFVVLMLRKYHRGVYFFFIWPLVFVLSRIYVGVHYPSDLLVGAFVGVSFALLSNKTCRTLLYKF